MPATFTDQVEKLDIRSMMGAALKTCPSDRYAVCCNAGSWRAVPEGQALQLGDTVFARIQLNRIPAKGALQPWWGQVILSGVQADGRPYEQALWLTAALTRCRRWRWAARCPYSGQAVQTLYFDYAAQQFISRQVAGLKYRRRRGKVRNYRARMFAIMRELEATHCEPFIPKPLWMTEVSYQALMYELTEMHLRVLCRQLGLPRPGPYEPPFDYANSKPERLSYPPSLVFFYRNKDGVRQLKAKYKKCYGLGVAA